MIASILVISGIGAVLALLLELADRFIADYGECRIRINEEKELTVQGGSPLLFTLQDLYEIDEETHQKIEDELHQELAKKHGQQKAAEKIKRMVRVKKVKQIRKKKLVSK